VPKLDREQFFGWFRRTGSRRVRYVVVSGSGGRVDNRKAADLFGLVMLNLVITTGIKYAELTKKAEEPKDEVVFSKIGRASCRERV
jgi:hypothetical protein